MPWRQILRESYTSLEALASDLQLPIDVLGGSDFSLLVPRRLAAKMERGNRVDPLLLQFVPLGEERELRQGFVADPVEDQRFQKTPRLLHKYAGRVLLVTTGACAMHCRYCFRQHFPYPDSKEWGEELAYIAGDLSIREVILSGGDPLSLPNPRLAALIEGLERIPHLRRLRFHTRFPIGIPERIDEGFLELLRGSRLQCWFVVHCNHPRELDEEVVEALSRIRQLGIPVLNQAVLLKGVNDSIEVLQELAERLADSGIQFYYLHQLDRVEGASHFEVESQRGSELVEALRERLSGYAVPLHVQEVAGEPSKVPIKGLNAPFLAH